MKLIITIIVIVLLIAAFIGIATLFGEEAASSSGGFLPSCH